MDALELDTPALYVDLDVLERNIARMQEQCRAWGVALRPHVKTHKIAEIAWTMRKLNEEHGYVEIDGPARVGEKVWVVPSHVCATVNLHDEIAYGRGGRVEGSWKVAARGKVR